MNPGRRRAHVACSNAYARRISVASLHAGPMNEMFTGRPEVRPAGTVTIG